MSRPFPENMVGAHIYQESVFMAGTSLRKAAEKSEPARARLVPGQILVHQDDVLAPIPVHVGDPETRRSEEHTSELQSPCNLVCRLLLEKKKVPQVGRQLGVMQTTMPHAICARQLT